MNSFRLSLFYCKEENLNRTIFEEEINDVERFHGMIAIF